MPARAAKITALALLASLALAAPASARIARAAGVSIGPQTTKVAEKAGLRVVAAAPTHDLDGLVEAVKVAACSSRS